MSIIISAPFGNYLNFKDCTSTIGTYTLYRRAGFFKRWWKVLSTVRYNRRQKSWINKLGLPNVGIDYIDNRDLHNKIISIHGFTEAQWTILAQEIITNSAIKVVELNLSCPNVGHTPSINEVKNCIKTLNNKLNLKIIAKLPPIRWLDYAGSLFDLGINHFHCCNTIPTPGGGISGKPLQQYSLWAIEEIKSIWSSSVIIGGGGITDLDDVKRYINTGADHIALGSMLFNPFNWKKIKQFNDYLEEINKKERTNNVITN